MEEFRIISPSRWLAPYVKNYWLLKTASDSPAVARTVPTGAMSLVFHRGDRLLSVHENEFHPRAFLNGHEKTFADLQYDGQINMISAVFRPAGMRAFFRLPFQLTTGLRLTAGDLEDKELSALETTLATTAHDGQCILLIERFLLKRLSRPAGHHHERIAAAIRLIDAGCSDITALAHAACLSRKQFDRVFSEQVGTNPKEFSRIIPFQRALHLLETEPQLSLTELAYACGYFDQSHMIKEFKALSGYTPGGYLAVCPPHSDYFS